MQTFWMALFLLCKTVEHMTVVHKFFTHKESMHFTMRTYDWVMRQLYIQLPLFLLSDFTFFDYYTVVFILYGRVFVFLML